MPRIRNLTPTHGAEQRNNERIKFLIRSFVEGVKSDAEVELDHLASIAIDDEFGYIAGQRAHWASVISVCDWLIKSHLKPSAKFIPEENLPEPPADAK